MCRYANIVPQKSVTRIFSEYPSVFSRECRLRRVFPKGRNKDTTFYQHQDSTNIFSCILDIF